MNYQVEISARAEQNLEEIASYLELKWSNKVKIDFLLKLVEKLEFLEQMPFMYRQSNIKKDVRECVVNKHAILYFQVVGTCVEVITIQSTKQNFNKL